MGTTSNRGNNTAYFIPSPFEPADVQKSKEYGIQYARYIEREELLSETYKSKKVEWNENQAYFLGYQDTSRLRELLIDGDESYSRLDFTPLPIIPKQVNAMKANMALELYSPSVKSIDPTSSQERKDAKFRLQRNMYGGDVRKAYSQSLNTNLGAVGFTPSTEEETDLYMQLEYKQAQEVAMEQALKVVTKLNKYPVIQDQLLDDLMITGECVLKTGFSPTKGIEIQYVDRQRYIDSYDTSKLKDNREHFYAGEVKNISYVELTTRYGVEKAEMISHYNSLNKSTRNINIEKWDDIANSTAEVLFFEFKTTLYERKRKKYGRNGKTYTIKDVPNDYENPHDNVEVFDTERLAWMQGMYVLNSDILCDYREREWVVEDSLEEPKSSYIIYRTQQMPIVRRMIPFADRAHLALIKLDQNIANARPKGLLINQSAMMNVVDREGGEPIAYQDLMDMYNETGNLVFRQDEFAGNGLPMQETENGMANDVMRYLEIYNQSIAELHGIIGVPPIAAGGSPQDRVSTESNKIALNSSLNAIKFIKDALVGEDKGVECRLYKDIAERIINIDKYSNKKFKQFVQAIGENNYQELMELASFKGYKFNIDIQSSPDIAEREELARDIQIAMEQGVLTIEDKILLSNFKSPRLALMILRTRIKKNKEEQRQFELQKIEKQMQEAQQAAKMKAQGEAQQKQIELDGESRLEEQKHLQKMEEIQLQGFIDSQIAQNKEVSKQQLLEYQAFLKQSSQDRMEASKDRRQKDQQNFQREQAMKQPSKS